MNSSQITSKIKQIAYKSRRCVLDIAKKHSGAHIGGIFSILDFLSCFYFLAKKNKSINYYGTGSTNLELVFSKGHCYLAQLSVLDSLYNKKFYTSSYMKENTTYFGHPKRSDKNYHFQISSGSLGQGIVFGNGLAMANKIKKNKNKVISIIGDGEFNEGSCTEALLFAKQHKLNHTIIIDWNDQMSLDKTSNILDLGKISSRIKSYGIDNKVIDGHSITQLTEILKTKCFNKNVKSTFPFVIILKTVKGKGIKFMEKNIKWHHRRFKNDEYEQALKNLYIV